MKERNQVTIGIHRDKYNSLIQKKEAMEEILQRRVDWGTFFLTMVSQRPFGEAVAILHDVEGDEEANPDDYEEEPPWVTREDVEEVVDKAVDKIIGELKKLLASNTDKSAGKGNEKL